MTESTGGDLLVDALAQQGVNQIFGVPGVQLDPAFDALHKRADNIAFTCVRNEQAASYMADGYARSTGDVGVAMVVPGPGMLNTLAGVATAYGANSPVLLISGQIDTRLQGKGLGVLHEIPNPTGILSNLTKWNAMASTPEEIPQVVERAFRELRSGRPRPVAIEMPVNVIAAATHVQARGRAPYEPIIPDSRAIDMAAELLRTAKRPLIYVGGGAVAANASVALRELAERLEAPVVMSANGRSAIDSRHRLAFDGPSLSQFRRDADVVLAVGTRLASSRGDFVDLGRGHVIALNADEKDLHNADSAQVHIHGDARFGIDAILAGIGEHSPDTRQSEFDAVRTWTQKQFLSVEPQLEYLRAIRSALPDDGFFVSELTQVGYVANLCFPSYEPRSYIGAGNQGTLGYGFATALGVKSANPNRAVLSVNGDGGFSWTLQELSTAKKYGIGLVTVVFNDGHFGNVRRIQRDSYGGRFIATELANPDYRKLAGAFGIASETARNPEELQSVLKNAFTANEPILVDAPVGEFPDPWKLIIG